MITPLEKKYFKLAVGMERIGKETDVDIEARCPICGDSKKNKNKKRLHLYNKGTEISLVNCYNGDCPVNHNIFSFLRDFYPSLLDQYKKENFKTKLETLSNEKNDVFENLKTQDSLEDVLNNTDLTSTEEKNPVLTQDLSTYFKPIEENSECLQYLNKRGIKYTSEYGNWFFGFQDLKIGGKLYKTSNSIVIPLYYKNQMYGFYSRNIYDKTFSTYMHDANIGFKIFNWFNVNKDKNVYISEGIFDALSIGCSNIIALMGAKLPEPRLKELKKPIFVLDNDRTGTLNAIEYAKRGHYVFVQPDIYKEKDINELKLKHPDLNILDLINNNIFTGISAEVRLKRKL